MIVETLKQVMNILNKAATSVCVKQTNFSASIFSAFCKAFTAMVTMIVVTNQMNLTTAIMQNAKKINFNAITKNVFKRHGFVTVLRIVMTVKMKQVVSVSIT